MHWINHENNPLAIMGLLTLLWQMESKRMLVFIFIQREENTNKQVRAEGEHPMLWLCRLSNNCSMTWLRSDEPVDFNNAQTLTKHIQEMCKLIQTLCCYGIIYYLVLCDIWLAYKSLFVDIHHQYYTSTSNGKAIIIKIIINEGK